MKCSRTKASIYIIVIAVAAFLTIRMLESMIEGNEKTYRDFTSYQEKVRGNM
jgi:hypothetical protein